LTRAIDLDKSNLPNRSTAKRSGTGAPFDRPGPLRDSAVVAVEAGYTEGSAVVHLTHTSLVSHALCGEESIGFQGEPELAVICDDCDRIGRELGHDPEAWMQVAVAVTFRKAA
jgi:hypothetical protein